MSFHWRKASSSADIRTLAIGYRSLALLVALLYGLAYVVWVRGSSRLAEPGWRNVELSSLSPATVFQPHNPKVRRYRNRFRASE